MLNRNWHVWTDHCIVLDNLLTQMHGAEVPPVARSVPVHLRSAGWAPGGFCFSMDFSRFHQNITGHFCIHIISYSPAYSSWMFTNVHDVGLAIAGQSWDVYPMLSFVSRVTGPAWCSLCRSPGWDKERWDWKRSVRPNLRPDRYLLQGSRHRDSVTELPTKKSILLSLPYQAPVDFNVWSAIGWKYCLNSGVLWTLTCLRDITRQCLVACTSIANSVGMSMSLVHNAGSCCFLVKPEVAYRLRHAENPWTLPLQGPEFRKGIYIYNYIYLYIIFR